MTLRTPFERRHFEHKCYNKHSFQRIKSFGKKSLTPHIKLEKENF